jgi:hypothetical protein
MESEHPFCGSETPSGRKDPRIFDRYRRLFSYNRSKLVLISPESLSYILAFSIAMPHCSARAAAKSISCRLKDQDQMLTARPAGPLTSFLLHLLLPQKIFDLSCLSSPFSRASIILPVISASR